MRTTIGTLQALVRMASDMVSARDSMTDGPNHEELVNSNYTLGGLVDAIGIIATYTDEHLEDMGDIFRVVDKIGEPSPR